MEEEGVGRERTESEQERESEKDYFFLLLTLFFLRKKIRRVDPFAPDAPIKSVAIETFPPDVFFVLRVIQVRKDMRERERVFFHFKKMSISFIFRFFSHHHHSTPPPPNASSPPLPTDAPRPRRGHGRQRLFDRRAVASPGQGRGRRGPQAGRGGDGRREAVRDVADRAL